ncbi:MAG: PEP-CTERM sorting domain-containing protein, partial [Planctomycetota bacterium]|nr:PEP-CTERM sorting domain-containing protein [Planctomycetota bacterium]
ASASVGDYVDIKGYGKLHTTSSPDYGDTFRVKLYEGVTYLAYTNPHSGDGNGENRRFGDNPDPGNPFPHGDLIDDTVLTIVDGGATAATGDNFDFAAEGYQFVDANDDGTTNTDQFALSSSIEFTAARTGYHYFFVTESHTQYGDGASSVDLDDDAGYSFGAAGGIYQGINPPTPLLTSGMYASTSGGLTPTGSVFGDIEADLYYWLRIEQKAGNPPVNPVPEPSSIAIFSVVGIGGLMLRRRMKKKS